MSWVERLLDRLVALQDRLLDDEYIRAEAQEAEGRKSVIVILGPKGVVYPLEIRGGRISKGSSTEGVMHTIRMSVDTFLNLVSGVSDLDTEYSLGHIDVQGKDWHLHASKWRREFWRLKKLFSLLR